MPEKGYTYSQQLVLELVKSQYGVAVIGVLMFPLFGITLGALLAPVIAKLLPDLSAGAKAALEKLPPIEQLFLIISPASAVLYLGKEKGAEVAKKVIELNLFAALGAGVLGLFRFAL